MTKLRPVVTDDDYEDWRSVRTAVMPYERTATVAELRGMDRPGRLLLVAERDGVVVGSGITDQSDLAGRCMIVPRVVPAYRRQGVGTALMVALAEHAAALGHTRANSGVDDEPSLGFAQRFGFAEVDRQVEQLRTIGAEAHPGVRADVEVVTVAQRPELWPQAYHQLARVAMQDMAVVAPMEVTLEAWERDWINEPAAAFVALAGDEVVGLASLMTEEDRPERAEQGFTAVRRDWRGRGVAAHLKRMTLWWAAEHGIAEVYTWTQQGNDDMRAVNEKLGFRYGLVSIRVEADLPLAAVAG